MKKALYRNKLVFFALTWLFITKPNYFVFAADHTMTSSSENTSAIPSLSTVGNIYFDNYNPDPSWTLNVDSTNSTNPLSVIVPGSDQGDLYQMNMNIAGTNSEFQIGKIDVQSGISNLQFNVQFLQDNILHIKGNGAVTNVSDPSSQSINFSSSSGATGTLELIASGGNLTFTGDIKDSGSNMLKQLTIDAPSGSETVSITDSNGFKVQTLNVNGATTINNAVTAQDLNIGNTLSITGNLSVSNDLTFTTAAASFELNSGDSVTNIKAQNDGYGALTLNAVNITGNIGATGKSLASLETTGTNLSISGDVYAQSLIVGNQTSVSGNVTVNNLSFNNGGQFTIDKGDSILGNIVTKNSVNNVGSLTFNANDASSASSYNLTFAGNIGASGASLASLKTTSTTLADNDSVTLSGNIFATNATSEVTTYLNGNAQIGTFTATESGSLTFAGADNDITTFTLNNTGNIGVTFTGADNNINSIAKSGTGDVNMTINTVSNAVNFNVNSLAATSLTFTGSNNVNISKVSGSGVSISSDNISFNSSRTIFNDSVTFNDTTTSNANISSGSIVEFKNTAVSNLDSFTNNGTIIFSGSSGSSTLNNIQNNSGSIMDVKYGNTINSTNYTQKSGSTLKLDLSTANFSDLTNLSISPTISGTTVNIENGSTVQLVLPTLTIPTGGIDSNGVTVDLVSATTLTANVSNITLSTNNSNSNLALSLQNINNKLSLLIKSVTTSNNTSNNSSDEVSNVLNGISGLDSGSTLGQIKNKLLTSSNATQDLQSLKPKKNNEVAASAHQINSESISVVEVRIIDLVSHNNTVNSGISSGNTFSKNFGVWGQVVTKKYDQNARKGAEGFDGNMSGLVLGGDAETDDGNIIGIATSFLTNNAKTDSGGGTEVNSNQFLLYSTIPNIQNTNFFTTGVLSYAKHNYDTARYINIVSQTAKAKFSGEEYSVKTGLGYNIKHEEISISPVINLYYSNLALDNYTEQGAGNAGLVVTNKDYKSFAASFITDFSFKQKLDLQHNLFTNLSAGYTRNFITTGQESSANFIAGGNQFSQIGVKRQSNIYDFSAGLTLISNDNFSVTTKYTLQTANKFIAHTGLINSRFNF